MKWWIVATVLAAAFVAGTASAASAQGQPYDMLSLGQAMGTPSVPDATVGYRFDTNAVVVVVPDTVGVDATTLRTIDQGIWAHEPVRFGQLQVWHSDRMLTRQSYAELTRAFGKRPAGLEGTSVRQLGDSLDRAVAGTSGLFLWLKAIAFAVICGVVAIMLVVVLFVLVSAQWRRAQADAK